MTIQIPKRQKKEMLSWLLEGLPNEACGLLAVVRQDNTIAVKKFYVMHNVDESKCTFAPGHDSGTVRGR